MQKNYCTPIPAARISDKVSPELKIATANACAAEIYAVTAGGKALLGKYVLKKGLESNRIYPDLSGTTGKFEFEINFKDNDGNTEETIHIPYEVVKSDVPSTGMIDGCWITLYHWSEAEGTYFNEGLKNLDADGWRQIIYSMHKAKITSVLIQNVFDAGNYAYQHNMTVDTYDGKAFYPSKLYKNRMPIRCEDPLEVILTAADECGMHVFPGVGMYAWFEFSPDSLEWHKRVTVELNERYGHHKSFYGWYISEEIMGSLYFDYPAVPNEKYKDIQSFFKEYTAFVRRLTPTKPVALAPNNIHMHWYEKEWLPILENLDIIIPFAFARSEYNIDEIMNMCRKTGTHFWVDMEMFAVPFTDGLRPKKIPDLLKEMKNYDKLEQIYGYQYTGIMNEPGHRMNLGLAETEKFYSEYMNYLKTKEENGNGK